MALRTVKRITISLPKKTIKKLNVNIPKSKRSKFLATLIEKAIPDTNVDARSLEVHKICINIASMEPTKTDKTALQIQREDRKNH